MFHHYQLRINNLELKTAAERVAFRLNFLAECFGHIQGKGTLIEVPLVCQDIADSLSLARDTVGHLMSDFIKNQFTIRVGSQILNV